MFYLIQLFIFSFCVNVFTIFAFFMHRIDLLITVGQSKIQPEYDYIIVGSGTAGSLIAHRMATETNHSFIVLEAGTRSTPLIEIPVLGPLLHGSIFDWQFETVPQKKACLAMDHNKCQQTQGKIVGGCSKLNNMIHMRGNISHYVNWFGGKFSEEYIETQFDLLENHYLRLQNKIYESELSDGILRAAEELGYSNTNNQSTKNQFTQGFLKPTVSQRNGRRWTTSDHLDINKHVATNSYVENLIIKKNKCVGVKLYDPNDHKEVYAKKGVILSAGAFNSPKILQLSGIGPSKLLNSLEIPVVKDLPVGKNLQDHVGSGLDLVLFDSSLSINPFSMLNPFNIYDYFFNEKGPLTSTGVEALGFLSTKNDTTPDLQFMALPVGISSDRGSHLKKSLSIKDAVWHEYFAKLYDKHAATIFATILHPKSKGEVYIASKDPLQKPVIDPMYLTHATDIEVLVNGFKLVKKFIETDAMKSLGAKINTLPFPGCERHTIFTDAYWECYVQHLTLTSYHPIGTCAMGSPNSTDAVVDSSFKVIGIDNLYVADSSVLPTLPSANINAAVAMMASVFFESNIETIYDDKNSGFCYKNDMLFKKQTKVCDKYSFKY